MKKSTNLKDHQNVCSWDVICWYVISHVSFLIFYEFYARSLILCFFITHQDNSVVKAVIDGNKEEFDSVFNTFNMEVITWMDEEYQSWRIGSFDMVCKCIFVVLYIFFLTCKKEIFVIF